jgi:integrase
MKTRLRYVREYRDEYGKLIRQFRYRGRYLRLPGRPGSLEFMNAYYEALNAVRPAIGAKRSLPETMGAVIAAYYQDRSFTGLAESTRGMRRRILEKIRGVAGDKPIRDLTKGHIVSVFLSPLPTFERNNWIKTLRGLMNFALERELIAADPTEGIKKSETGAGTIHTWTEDQIAQFEARHGIGSTARLALALLLYTAQRRSDVVKMGPQHVKDGVLSVRQKKTRMEKADRVLAIPVLPELAAIIAATPTGQMSFLVTHHGVPYTEKGFGTRFGDWCQQAGLPAECSSHGLRKAGLVRLAEAGCTEAELRAISGHTNLGQLKVYIEKVEQRHLAANAMAKLQANGTRTSGGGKGSNPPRIHTVVENAPATKVSRRLKNVSADLEISVG